jgi:AcrR family transcriptional regulator
MAPSTKATARTRPRKEQDRSDLPGSGAGEVGAAVLSDREIVRAARELVAEVGVDGLTMRRLSAKLGVALGATYHHVPTRRDLLLLLAHDLYDDVAVPKEGTWDYRIKKLMVDIAEIVGRYPGMAAFMNANAADSTPVELNHALIEILRKAGFSHRDVNAVMAALFFYVTGMSSGSLNATSLSTLTGADIRHLFEDGLDILLAGAKVRLEANESARPSRRPPDRARAPAGR